MKKLEEFEQTHQDALQHIKDTLENDTELKDLVKWMLETDQNPYSYIPDCAGYTYTSAGLSSLVRQMQHAIYDEGDICFVKDIYGAPSIRLEDPWYIERGEEVLDIKPCNFLEVYTNYVKGELRINFISAAARNFEQAYEHYSKNSLWEESWVESCKEDIEDKREFLKLAGVI